MLGDSKAVHLYGELSHLVCLQARETERLRAASLASPQCPSCSASLAGASPSASIASPAFEGERLQLLAALDRAIEEHSHPPPSPASPHRSDVVERGVGTADDDVRAPDPPGDDDGAVRMDGAEDDGAPGASRDAMTASCDADAADSEESSDAAESLPGIGSLRTPPKRHASIALSPFRVHADQSTSMSPARGKSPSAAPGKPASPRPLRPARHVSTATSPGKAPARLRPNGRMPAPDAMSPVSKVYLLGSRQATLQGVLAPRTPGRQMLSVDGSDSDDGR